MTGTQPLWTIGIVTQVRREEKFLRLLSFLLPQLLGLGGAAEVVALRNNCGKTIHEYRQAVLDDARGAYFSFVDDDDMVESDFVRVVTEQLRDYPGVDYVAFGHRYYERGVLEREVRTGLNIGPPCNLPEYYVRPVTHVNPVRTELARQAGFLSDSGHWEDYGYHRKVEKLARTEAVIDRVLYHYFHDWADSIMSGVRPVYTIPRRPAITAPGFRWHPWSIQ